MQGEPIAGALEGHAWTHRHISKRIRDIPLLVELVMKAAECAAINEPQSHLAFGLKMVKINSKPLAGNWQIKRNHTRHAPAAIWALSRRWQNAPLTCRS